MSSQLVPLAFFQNNLIVNKYIMWICGFVTVKKKKKWRTLHYLARLSRLCKSPGLACVRFLTLIATFQCWTAAPSSLPFKSFYWSISSCADSSQVTRPLRYKRYAVSACHGHFLNVVFNSCESSLL